MGSFGGKYLILEGLVLLSLGYQSYARATATADLSVPDEFKARIALSQKLLKLSQNVQMKEARYKDSGNAQTDTNANDGNSFSANSTYHSYVWDYCQSWIGPRRCQNYLDPYVSIHGQGADRSVLEGVVYDAYKQFANARGDSADGGSRYKIWDVKTDGGAITDNEGRIDRAALTSWKLTPEVNDRVRKVGTDTAEQLISTTFESDEAKDGTVMPNMETLREMAERFTRQVRNRLVANTGEIRAAQPGIEVAQGEDIPKCGDYAKALQNNPDRFHVEAKIDPQAPLDVRTRANQIEDRLALCEKVKNMSIYSVNPQTTGAGQASATTADGAWVDEWRTRASLLTIDQAGASPNEVELPRNAKLDKEDFKSNIAVYEEGGRAMRSIAMTNMEQMDSYNQGLEDAKAGYKSIAARTDRIPDRSDEIDQWKLKKGEINLVKLNGMTPDQRLSVQGSFPRDQATGSPNDPSENLETTPNQIVVRTK